MTVIVIVWVSVCVVSDLTHDSFILSFSNDKLRLLATGITVVIIAKLTTIIRY